MPRRSYLHRIAEPLRSGEPVLFAVPRPLPTEARAPVEAPTISQDAAEPTRAPTLHRRAATRGTIPATPDLSAAAVGAPVAAAPCTLALGNTAAPAGIARAPTSSAALPSRTVATIDDPGAISRASALPPMLGEPQMRPAAVAPSARAAARILASPTAPLGRAAEPRHVSSSQRPAPFAPDLTAPDVTMVDLAASSLSRPVSIAPAIARPPSTPASGAAPAPRIHIGTVEVRTTTPPAAPPAPRAAPEAPQRDTAPIARGYAWRFGLLQG
jgi:hypothetical protein